MQWDSRTGTGLECGSAGALAQPVPPQGQRGPHLPGLCGAACRECSCGTPGGTGGSCRSPSPDHDLHHLDNLRRFTEVGPGGSGQVTPVVFSRPGRSRSGCSVNEDPCQARNVQALARWSSLTLRPDARRKGVLMGRGVCRAGPDLRAGANRIGQRGGERALDVREQRARRRHTSHLHVPFRVRLRIFGAVQGRGLSLERVRRR